MSFVLSSAAWVTRNVVVRLNKCPIKSRYMYIQLRVYQTSVVLWKMFNIIQNLNTWLTMQVLVYYFSKIMRRRFSSFSGWIVTLCWSWLTFVYITDSRKDWVFLSFYVMGECYQISYWKTDILVTCLFPFDQYGVKWEFI